MDLFYFISVVLLGMTMSVMTGKLTIAGAFTGGALAAFIFFGVGWAGIALMGAFFLVGTAVTAWGRRKKEAAGLVGLHDSRRTAGQVFANGGAGGVLGLLAILFPSHSQLFLLMVAAAFSSATADTVSSELGSLFGSYFFDIISFRKAKKGLDGVISMEGLLFGIAGSIMIAGIYAAFSGWNAHFYWIILAGTVGNVVDSVLGATVERKQIIANDAVNFLNTTAAAIFMAFVI